MKRHKSEGDVLKKAGRQTANAGALFADNMQMENTAKWASKGWTDTNTNENNALARAAADAATAAATSAATATAAATSPPGPGSPAGSPPGGSHFTTNWFTHNTPALLRVFEILGWAAEVGTRPKHVLEVGSWEGRSSQWLLTTLCRHKHSTLTCVDTWQGGIQYRDIGLDLDGDAHQGNVIEARFDANIARVTGKDLL